MIEINAGNRWNFSYLQKITEMNNENKAQEKDIMVTMLYGDCITEERTRTGVRTNIRIPVMIEKDRSNLIRIANLNNIRINITMNKSCIDTMNITKVVDDAIEHYDTYGNGVIFTAASMVLIHEMNKHNLPIELSTIFNQDSFNFIAAAIEKYRSIKKVCIPIYMNRDFKKLRQLTDSFPDVCFEVIVNELCISGLNTCIYRQDCYNAQSHSNSWGKELFEICTDHRIESPVSWLMAPFIIPQWMRLYSDVAGVTSFKLTGRTMPDDVLLLNVLRYMQEEATGDITSLWGTSLPNQPMPASGMFIEDLVKDNFISYFVNNDFMCNKSYCGVRCKHCYNEYNKLNS